MFACFAAGFIIFRDVTNEDMEKRGCWEDTDSSQTKSLVISSNRGNTFPSNKMQEGWEETWLWQIFLGCFVVIIYHLKAVLCVHSSTSALREAGSCLRARMGENKGLVRKVYSLFEVLLPCTQFFNSVDELAQESRALKYIVPLVPSLAAGVISHLHTISWHSVIEPCRNFTTRVQSWIFNENFHSPCSAWMSCGSFKMHLLLPKDHHLSFLEVFYRNAKFCRWGMFQMLLEFDDFFFVSVI